mmetsp:Transcript_1949/g.4871  ORF Transcript_1949/g.4871 Transcript_1949/m.4871 type:complete len:260 (-) Transcript_1949:128-907(-)
MHSLPHSPACPSRSSRPRRTRRRCSRSFRSRWSQWMCRPHRPARLQPRPAQPFVTRRQPPTSRWLQRSRLASTRLTCGYQRARVHPRDRGAPALRLSAAEPCLAPRCEERRGRPSARWLPSLVPRQGGAHLRPCTGCRLAAAARWPSRPRGRCAFRAIRARLRMNGRARAPLQRPLVPTLPLRRRAAAAVVGPRARARGTPAERPTPAPHGCAAASQRSQRARRSRPLRICRSPRPWRGAARREGPRREGPGCSRALQR